MLGFKSFKTAQTIISGIEILHMLHKRQIPIRGNYQNTIVNPNKTSKVQVVKAEGTANNLQNEQEDSVEDLYAQLQPRERSIRELPANSACKDFNKYLVIQSEIVSHTDEKITYKITATNHSPFPIQQARGALQIIDTVNNRYICDYVAWGFDKEDGSNINPGENINKIYETGKRHRCDSDFIKNPNNGYLLGNPPIFNGQNQ